MMPSSSHALFSLPPDDALRHELHNEVHARPSADVRLPAWVMYVALLNEGVSREDEWHQLKQLSGQDGLALSALKGNFLRLHFDHFTVKWERHTEFTRYSIVQNLPAGLGLGAIQPQLMPHSVLPPQWLSQLPGRTMAAIHLIMDHGLVNGTLEQQEQVISQAQDWFGHNALVQSKMGNTVEGLSHSWLITDFKVAQDGFERMLVVAAPGMKESRTGRISQRLLEIETYRLMALRGLPVAKALGPMLSQAEDELARITASLESKATSDEGLLDILVSLAARIERTTAQHMYRFGATRAYEGIVTQRISELRERSIDGTPTIGEFMRRRLSPAIGTVFATAQRLGSLSERITRTSALLRTRVDIATEVQNQQLLEKLTRGQAMQLRLQATVEGLSIAAISYYVVSLIYYGAKALKASGLPIQPEVAAGMTIPLVLWVVWRASRKLHQKIIQID